MFPTGAAGVALILLRVSVATTLITRIMSREDLTGHTWEFLGLSMLGIVICIGLFTPVASIGCCLIEIAMLLNQTSSSAIPLLCSMLVAVSLALLGPGAYSLDARMFGRRLVVSSSDKR